MNAQDIQNIFQNTFSPEHVEVIDDSDLHRGHAGQRESGGGHYSVTLVADVFEGQTLVQRHRTAYEAVKMNTNEAIHALALKIYTPKEWQSKKSI
jgi:BolA protein